MQYRKALSGIHRSEGENEEYLIKYSYVLRLYVRRLILWLSMFDQNITDINLEQSEWKTWLKENNFNEEETDETLAW